MSIFTIADIPAQTGKLAIVTGANSGIGYETALELARAGATVILAGRNVERGLSAVGRILAAVPAAKVSAEQLDLASLRSVAAFAGRIAGAHQAVDLLINNAGVMQLPKRLLTEDGFETQFGTNYLGHFALTARLLPLLVAGHARVVQLASIAARGAVINFDDLQAAQTYRPGRVYGQSKLAMLMFALELQRRSDAHGWGLLSVAAHPGVASSALIDNGIGTGIAGKIGNLGVRLVGQSAAAGALPVLYAATAKVAPGGYYGSTGFKEIRGPAGAAKIVPPALDVAAAKRLWDVSEQLTGAKFSLPPAPAEPAAVA